MVVAMPRQYGCRRCHRPLNREIVDGLASYHHPLEEIRSYDHPPEPRLAEQLGPLIHSCDFCAQEDTIIWTVDSDHLSIEADTGRERRIQSYGTSWACCPTCFDL